MWWFTGREARRKKNERKEGDGSVVGLGAKRRERGKKLGRMEGRRRRNRE